MPRIPINMPKMSMTMETGTLVEWSVKVGDTVNDGDLLCVVTTDKVDMDVESVTSGVVAELLIQPGDSLPVGQPMAWLDSATEDLLGDLFAAPGAQAEEPAGQVAAETPAPAPAEAPPQAPGERIRAVPLARTLAKEHGLDLAALAAAQPGRVVRARDVRMALENAAPTTPPATPAPAPAAAAATPAPAQPTDRRSRLRQATANVMEKSAAVPQFTAYRTLDLTQTARARTAGLKGVSWTTILVRAYAMTLEQYPHLNGSWAEGRVRENDDIVISLAVDTPDGLLAPAVVNPQRTSMKALDADVRDIASRLKEGDQDRDLFRPGTGTVSNLGGMGVEMFNALLTPPQATALSLGTVDQKLRAGQDGTVTAFTGCTVGLTIDHRVADGADAARALDTLQALVSDPILLLS